ncbi:autotransporter outer membrane beta-barrel domain-containing protein, partial [Campylobacter jejuni]
NFNNSGMIQGAGDYGYGMNISQGTITNFNNSGTIKSNKDIIAVAINNGTSIETFNNSGFIQGAGSWGTIYVNNKSTIKTFINTGTIKDTGNTQPSIYTTVSSGVYLYQSRIDNFTNQGLISGIIGLDIISATINNFNNKGTIESTSSHEHAAAINLITANAEESVVDKFINCGTITSKSNGIISESGNRINTLINKGIIEASLNGISFYDFGDSSGNEIKLGKIILEEGSSIQARNNGINIDHGTSKAIEADGIEVQKGAVVEGGNSGIYIGGGKEINAQIKIEGTVTGETAGIVNEGVIGSNTSSGSTGG